MCIYTCIYKYIYMCVDIHMVASFSIVAYIYTYIYCNMRERDLSATSARTMRRYTCYRDIWTSIYIYDDYVYMYIYAHVYIVVPFVTWGRATFGLRLLVPCEGTLIYVWFSIYMNTYTRVYACVYMYIYICTYIMWMYLYMYVCEFVYQIHV